MIRAPGVYHISCPYCDNEMKINAEYASQISNGGYFVIRCDVDDSPGCDQLFVVDIVLEAVVTTMRLEAGQ